jgi:hypothetical protein
MQLTDILTNPIVIAVVALVAGMLIHRYASKQAPGKVAQTVQADAFGIGMKFIQALADTSGHDAAINAALQAKAPQLAQLDHVRTVLNGMATGPQPAQPTMPASTQPPSAP